ncbi:MAG: HD-GYP domain-containing protein [Spirochaetales bacterium]|nr:HD-GYP domain-containing protein [Spirochaetales bacterium]
MKSISVAGLMPHSFFTSPVYLDKGYIILSPDTPVTTDLINRLKLWNYSYIFSEKDPSIGPQEGLSETSIIQEGVLDHTIQEQEKQQKIMTFYFDLIQYLDAFIKDFMKKNELDMTGIIGKVKEIISIMKDDKDFLLHFTAKKHPVDNYLIPHAVNSTLIALGIGDYLKLPAHKLIDLGVAGLLHEIGMTKVPPGLIMGNKNLSAEEKKTVISHTLWGYRILKNFSVPDNIAAVSLEHHERTDGSGYPRKLKGETISLYSRIIAVTCSYDSSVSKRPYKNPVDSHKALLYLLSTQKARYDDQVLKALVYTLSIFPLGTYVLLSNNTKGMVYRTNPVNPKSPVIKLVSDENGREIQKPIYIEISKEKEISIVRTLTPEEFQV